MIYVGCPELLYLSSQSRGGDYELENMSGTLNIVLWTHCKEGRQKQITHRCFLLWWNSKAKIDVVTLLYMLAHRSKYDVIDKHLIITKQPERFPHSVTMLTLNKPATRLIMAQRDGSILNWRIGLHWNQKSHSKIDSFQSYTFIFISDEICFTAICKLLPLVETI